MPVPVAEDSRVRGEWKRVAGLLFLLLAFSAIPSLVLVGLPFVLMVLLLPIRRRGALLMAAVAMVLVLGGTDHSGLWYAERGWALLVGGWYVASTLRWPGAAFWPRALGSVLGAAATTVAFFAVRPLAWSILDWGMGERIRQGTATAVRALQMLQGGETVSPALMAAVYSTAESQAMLFPALSGLASLAALGVAWWLYVRVALGRQGALGPLQDFRFNDQLVWFLVAGLVTLGLGAGDAWTRLGSNAVVFMGALYALRGAAVVLFINGGISTLGVVALTVGMLFLAPALVIGALLIGLGDTWLDLRKRATRTADTGR